jgi:hypothetical protein
VQTLAPPARLKPAINSPGRPLPSPICFFARDASRMEKYLAEPPHVCRHLGMNSSLTVNPASPFPSYLLLLPMALPLTPSSRLIVQQIVTVVLTRSPPAPSPLQPIPSSSFGSNRRHRPHPRAPLVELIIVVALPSPRSRQNATRAWSLHALAGDRSPET